MKTYKTQMEAAKKGIMTEAMKRVAADEGITIDYLMGKMAVGEIVIPCNINHHNLQPVGIGTGLRTKVNVNLGISKDCNDSVLELDKAKLAIELKADAIMDLSNYGKTKEFRQGLIELSSVMIGTVPMYDAVGFYDRELKDIEAKEFLDVLCAHGEDGVDFVTIHAGINQESAKRFLNNRRLTNIVSRGGTLLFAWMQLTGKENPFYEYFDEVLEICRAYDMTISLGDALRPGSIHDATDASQIHELITLGELTKRAWKKDVQVMIEGPGHMAIDEIEANVILEKRLCHKAPFYVLGPLVTDIAPGYDHITGAIGGALAASKGVDFLCYLTPAEHLRLPSLEDMKEGLIATRIAAHAGDIAKGVKGAGDWDNAMSQARVNLDWEGMFKLSIDEAKAREYREHAQLEDEKTCTMCGKMCAVRNINKILNSEEITML